jgi:hypothetical protein
MSERDEKPLFCGATPQLPRPRKDPVPLESHPLRQRDPPPSLLKAQPFVGTTLKIRNQHLLEASERKRFVASLRNYVEVGRYCYPVVVLGEKPNANCKYAWPSGFTFRCGRSGTLGNRHSAPDRLLGLAANCTNK